MSTGLDYDQVGEQFDLPRMQAMNKYWDSFPPIHIMIARYLDVKPTRSDSKDSEANNDGLMQALQQLQQG